MKLFNHIKSILEKHENFAENGKIFKNKVVEAALKLDPVLLSILLKDETAKKTFFQEVDGLLVFDKVKFQKFVSNKEFLPDSFTAFKNKIGLTANGEYLTEANEVVLDFPFKDCVLEGGQTKEDQKRQEIFWNETLAPDEIDRMFEPKVFTNWKRYDKDGEHEVTSISKDDNFIIKGNNLIALHSLAKVYKGQVKLIYIDPPYNTGNDSFGYNDSFNHSTWLTFMKNRLEIAKQLLSNDGSIVVQLDWNESHYCKILLDEIFSKENFRNEIIWCYHGPGSPKMKQFNRKHDNLLWYSKSNNWTFNGDDVRMESEVHVGGFNNEMSKDVSSNYESKGKIPEDWWEVIEDREHLIEEITKVYDEYQKINDNDWFKSAVAARIRVDGSKRTGYLTEKPYRLMERVVKSFTNEGDLVLDFFAGSGTTGFVCNYLNRKFILIEQLEDTHEILRKRFENTSHIYCELALNNLHISLIKNASTGSTLDDFYRDILKNSPNLKYTFKKYDFEVDEFFDMELNSKKTLLLSLIDSNTFYIPLSDIEDEQYEVSKKDKKCNLNFYGND